MSAQTDQLMNDARCIDRCIPDGEKLAVLISLFQQWLATGGGGGGGGGTSVLTNTHLFVGNAANVATDVALSGDATIANTGVLTLANNATARSDIGLGTGNSPQFTALGLGVAASVAGSLVTSASIVAGTFFRGNETLLGAGTNLDWSLGDYFSKTITAATVFTFSNTGLSRTITVAILGDASHTVTWPAVRWAGGVAPVQTLSKVDMYTFVMMSDGFIYGSAVQNMS